MNDQMISMYIDDELTLDGKIDFVETVHASKGFTDEAIDLLVQEKLLRSDPVERVPERALKVKRSRVLRFLRPVALAAAGAAAALFIVFAPFTPEKPAETPFRFVFYRPDVSRVAITGSFTGWNAIPMKKVGDSGYWEYTLNLDPGEHRFAYLVNGGERLPDPTIPERERDDFGSHNTILSIGGRSV